MTHLNILIPGLLWNNINDTSYIYQDIEIPNLSQLLKNATYNIINNHSLSQVLYRLSTKSHVKSVAKLFAQQMNIQNEYSNFILCEPTHLRLDRDRLLISEAELLQLDKNEALEYIKLINEHFKQEIKLYYIHEELWLFGHNYQIDHHIRPPIIDIIGENIDDYINYDTRYSHQLNAIINEIQMLLYNCKYNQSRKKEGSLELNSIWLSDINLSSSHLPQFDRIYTNNLLKLFNNADSFDINTLNKLTNNDLLIIDDLYYPNCYLDNFGYIDRLKQLDSSIFLKLKELNSQGKIIKLIVPKMKSIIIINIPKTNIFNFWRKTNIIKLTKDTHET